MDIHLLADQPDAAHAVAQWWFDEWGRGIAGNTVDHALAEAQASMRRDRPRLAVVAVESDQPVGVAVWKPHEMIDRYPDHEHWLGGVYVVKEARGRGIATALTQAIIDTARANGAPHLYLQTESPDGGLYARLGWQPIERVNQKGHDVLVMVQRF